ncbi:MAG: NAD-dependent epimerase/dehydratase family protein [Acidimicrobiales bacterium]
MRVGITGATGYLGSVIGARLAAAGHEVVAFVRSSDSRGRRVVGEWEHRVAGLDHPARVHDLTDLDGLVLAAWDLTLVAPGAVWGTNVAGTQQMLRRARRAGVPRLLLVSSMSAYEGTNQLYGQAKLACERTARQLGGCVARPGLVYGPGAGGMCGALRSLTRLPVVPMIGGQAHQFLAHEDDVADAVLRLLTAPSTPAVPLGLAHPTPVALVEILRELARSEGRRLRAVAVPAGPVRAGLRLAEALHLPVPFRSDSLLGLERPAPGPPGVAELRALGVGFRPFTGSSVRPVL